MTVLQVIMICTQRVGPIASASAPSSISGPPPYPAAAPAASLPIGGDHISAQHKQRTHGRPRHDVQQHQPIGGGAGPPHWRAARAAHAQLELNTHALPLDDKESMGSLVNIFSQIRRVQHMFSFITSHIYIIDLIKHF